MFYVITLENSSTQNDRFKQRRLPEVRPHLKALGGPFFLESPEKKLDIKFQQCLFYTIIEQNLNVIKTQGRDSNTLRGSIQVEQGFLGKCVVKTSLQMKIFVTHWFSSLTRMTRKSILPSWTL